MKNNLMDKEINYESLSEYLKKRYPDWEISPDKQFGTLKIFLDELNSHSFRTIGEVHNDLERTEKAFKLIETKFPPDGKEGYRYSPIGIARISMCLLDRNFTLRDIKVNNIPPEELEECRKLILPEWAM
ncbi:MAG: hypothetical protein ABSH16_07645 [Sedimentisphaerales bacterium]